MWTFTALRRWLAPRFTPGAVLGIGWAAIILLLAAAAAVVIDSRLQAERNTDQLASLTATMAMEQLAHDVALIDRVLGRLKDDLHGADPPSLTPQQRRQILSVRADSLPPVAFLDILDADGNVTASLNDDERVRNWSNAEYFVVHRNSSDAGLYIGRPFSRDRPAATGITLSRRLNGPEASFAGVVVCGVRLGFISGLFAKLTLGPADVVTLYRNDGVVLARLPADQNASGYTLAASDLAATGLKAGSTLANLPDPIDHLTRRTALQPVPGTPLVIAVGLAPSGDIAGWPVTALPRVAALLIAALAMLGIVTWHRQQQRQQANTDRMMARRANMLATISHELRGSLHTILRNAEQWSASEGALCGGTAAAVSNEARSLAGLVDRLLEFWRLDAEGPALHPTLVNLPALIEECHALFAPEARDRKLALLLSLSPDAPSHFATDAVMLRQVLTNLLSNALKYTKGGSVTVVYAGTPDLIRIEVVDTGIGVPAAQKPRLFQRFSRLPQSEHDAAGTGLGLSIADHLIRLMGGKIEHDDNPGGGSIFWFELRPAALPAGNAVGPTAADRATKSLRILLADDSRMHRDITERLLRAAGHEVIAVSNGRQAIDIAAQRAFDLILLDMRMPGLDGLETLQQIRALPSPANALPVIAVTADALPTDIERYRASGFADFLGKPFDSKRLLAMVANVAARYPRRAADPSPANGPVLDPATLHQTQIALGEEETRRHLATFADNVDQLLDGLRADPASQECIERVHRAIADAGQLGFVALSRAALAWMQASSTGNDLATHTDNLLAAATAAQPVLATAKRG